jgi:hypothetical protein
MNTLQERTEGKEEKDCQQYQIATGTQVAA